MTVLPLIPPSNSQLSNDLPRRPEVQLWTTLDRVYTILSRQITNKVISLGLTAPQYRVLRQLRQTSVLSASELAKCLGVTPGNLTGILDRLEQEKLLTRQRGAENRRSLQVMITPSGEALMQQAVPQMQAYVSALFAPLGPDIAQMQLMLESLEQHLS